MTVPPKITLSHSNPYSVTQGNYVRLECRAEGLPAPTVQWRKHTYGAVAEPFARGGIPTSSAILEIAGVQPSDEGVYICEASNTGGSAQEYIQLQVDSYASYPDRGDIPGKTRVGHSNNF